MLFHSLYFIFKFREILQVHPSVIIILIIPHFYIIALLFFICFLYDIFYITLALYLLKKFDFYIHLLEIINFLIINQGIYFYRCIHFFNFFKFSA